MCSACLVALALVPIDLQSNCNIADENSRCCDCRECNETYAKRSKLARRLNVYDGVIQDIMLNSATHGQKAIIYYIVMM